MGIFDKARDPRHEHADRLDPVVGRLADEADPRTGRARRATPDQGADVAGDASGDGARRDTEPGRPG